nr:hypothetical protein Itr_chr06CG12610 [Ipomoea trifida]GME04487.1 hypothetical protein Iba_scaffold2050CG0010 [Ipomoea batatas]GME04489.1 hypothetical protein Iba_scaffold2051CG0010 [Ipomoea batatas]
MDELLQMAQLKEPSMDHNTIDDPKGCKTDAGMLQEVTILVLTRKNTSPPARTKSSSKLNSNNDHSNKKI